MPRSAPLTSPSILSLLSLALLAGGCGPTEPPETTRELGLVADDTVTPRKICTLELRMMLAVVVDAAGRPVEGATVTVTHPQGQTRTVAQDYVPGAGMYTVFTDGYLPLDSAGTTITARFNKDGKVHAEEYLLATDGCHFQVLSAPDTVRTSW